ncbi:hypothetical protein FWP33_07475 [Vibrio parahaemolyticus]|nr:hypothetical protein [Vibrio parahaemolyticus]
MKSNAIPITELAPSFSKENLDQILARVSQVLPNLSAEGAKQYISDLLNRNVDELVVSWLFYQELEPAVSSTELHALAERVLPYHSNELEEAVFAVRNILNTVPRQVSDLRDYLPRERKQDVIRSLSLPLITAHPTIPSIASIDELIEALKQVDQVIIDVTASTLMDEVQSIPMHKQPGLTTRQKMLSVAAVYEINSSVGFHCNSIWLASCINSEMWGCARGWVHSDGELCHSRHFGFKSDSDCVSLSLSSLTYVEDILAENTDKNTVSLYIDTLLAALTIMTRDYLRYVKETDGYAKLDEVIERNQKLMNPAQRLRYMTIQILLAQVKGVAKQHFEQLQSFFEYQAELGEPHKQYLQYYDYSNFIHVDFEYLKTPKCELPSCFLGSSVQPNHLLRTSELLHKCLQMDLPSDVTNLFGGFFTTYMWKLINDDSNEQFLYDAILSVSVSSMHLYENTIDNIRAMAELGHLASIKWLIDSDVPKSHEELKYWETRRDFLVARGQGVNMTLPFFPLVEKVQSILGNTEDVMRLSQHLPKDQFYKLRQEIIEAFEIGSMPDFDGEYEAEVELGDVSDAVITVTLEMYPQGTPLDKPICYDERIIWCTRILEAMDRNAQIH